MLANLVTYKTNDGLCGATTVVDVLIGSDYYWSLVSGRVRRGSTGPIALDTKVGWILSGPAEGQNSEETITVHPTHTLRIDTLTESDQLEQGLKRFWDLESMGVQREDESVHSKFIQEIEFRDGRYC